MIAMIDYDAGNTCSVMNALNRLQVDYKLTADPKVIIAADKVIFPGVGHAGAAMEALKKKSLVDTILSLQQPVLGICVGMQLLCEHSEEGDSPCLGIVPLTVTKMKASPVLKVPHMGWNLLNSRSKSHGLLQDVSDKDYFYFVHSYFVPSSEFDVATCDYGVNFCAIIQNRNFYGVQFHAEKSGTAGEQLLQNFIEII